MKSAGVAILSAALLIPLAAADSASAQPTDALKVAGSWPAAGYNAAMSNRNPDETALTSATVRNLVRKRGITLPPDSTSQCGFYIEPGPILVGTTLFTMLGSNVAAINVTNGQRKWLKPAVDADAPLWYSSLTVVHGRVYVGARDCVSVSDPNGALFAFNATTGAPLWSQHRIASIAAMVVTGGKIITSGINSGEPGSLNAYDAGTGVHTWINSACAPDPLIVVGQAIIAQCPTDGSSPAQLQALSLADGHVLWRKYGNWRQLRGDTDAATATAVFARSPAGWVTLLDPATGVTTWTSAQRGTLLAVGKSRVYVTCAGRTICALDRNTGGVLWKSAAIGPAAPSEAVIAADLVYPSPASKPLLASTGQSVSMYAADYPPGNGFAISSGFVLTSGLVSRVIDVYGLR
ncbi:MAG: PQQ-binding-like beta-propeller repeat protein [Mycobacteriales bacterium]